MLVWIFYDTKTSKAIFKPYNRSKSSRWTTIRVKGRNALYGLKNSLKSNPLIFYTVMSTRKLSVSTIFYSLTRTHVYTHQNSNQTHYGNHNTPVKKIFKKFFLSRNFKFLNFGFSRNFSSSLKNLLSSEKGLYVPSNCGWI